MRIAGKFAVISFTLLLAGCAYHRPPVVYTTPGGQVISTGPDARVAADRALETSLRAELNRYGDLANANPDLQVSANNGYVTLSGSVRNEKDRQMIDTLVRNTPGVTSVSDQLQVVYPPTGVVTPPPPYTAPVYPPPVVTTPSWPPRIEATTVGDEALASRIRDQLRLNGVSSDWLQNVTIRVSDGAAYVQGYVASQQQREAIDTAVQHVTGVTAVYDQLQLR
jgi:osmotically-inducible protein OsmY